VAKESEEGLLDEFAERCLLARTNELAAAKDRIESELVIMEEIRLRQIAPTEKARARQVKKRRGRVCTSLFSVRVYV